MALFILLFLLHIWAGLPMSWLWFFMFLVYKE